MDKNYPDLRNVRSRRQGAAAVEFAIVLPLFLALLACMVVFGGWLWMAQTVQHMASEGARAAIGGLNTGEREALARAAAVSAARGSGLRPDALAASIAEEDGRIVVVIDYNTAGHPLMALASLAPARPADMIRRTAIVRTGGD